MGSESMIIWEVEEQCKEIGAINLIISAKFGIVLMKCINLWDRVFESKYQHQKLKNANNFQYVKDTKKQNQENKGCC
ncbi:unnamed protein product [Paramecium primaurelia]|uniref:Uncharacterized protein n=1 Tax=Paramecium primaurelia TaxID=5886 RepID=A0A8S1QWU9_PARPR|nr:unnamed protein product [Paramecium primaurelia]